MASNSLAVPRETAFRPVVRQRQTSHAVHKKEQHIAQKPLLNTAALLKRFKWPLNWYIRYFLRLISGLNFVDYTA